MSSQSVGPTPQRRLLRRKSILIGCTAMGLVLTVVWFAVGFIGLRGIPTVAGGVSIKAGPGVKIFVGDKLIGQGNLSLSWDQLFGDDGQERLAGEVGLETLPVPAESLGYPGAQVLRRTAAGGAGVDSCRALLFEYLLRRTDGKLDQVFVLHADWQQPHGPPRRFLMLLRAREQKDDSTVFLGATTSLGAISRPSFVKLFGLSPSEMTWSIAFNPATAPGEFAQEIKDKGLWEPPANQPGNR